MAYFDSDSSSSDEFNTNCAPEDLQGLQGYLFEPRQDSVDGSSSSSGTSEISSEEGDQERDENRLGDGNTPPTWCLCSNCSTENLIREKECLCCKEKTTYRPLAVISDTDGSICVINNEDFRTLCCTPIVLRNVLVGMNNVRADNWVVNPPNNSGLRYAAYRQFSWWAHGKLGPSRRRVIPSCVTHAIRQQFPANDEETYTGFLSGDEDSD